MSEDTKPKKSTKSKPEAKDSTVEMSPEPNTLPNPWQLLHTVKTPNVGVYTTAAMYVRNVGVALRVSTATSEALTFMPGAKLVGAPGPLKIISE